MSGSVCDPLPVQRGCEEPGVTEGCEGLRGVGGVGGVRGVAGGCGGLWGGCRLHP